MCWFGDGLVGLIDLFWYISIYVLMFMSKILMN